MWALTDEQAATLLDLPVRTYARRKAGQQGRIDRDTKARLSNPMGIHKALRFIFHEADCGYRWIRAATSAPGHVNETASPSSSTGLAESL